MKTAEFIYATLNKKWSFFKKYELYNLNTPLCNTYQFNTMHFCSAFYKNKLTIMSNLSTSLFSAKITWNNPKANHKQKVLKFTDADLYSEESEAASEINRPKIKFIKKSNAENKIF